MFDINILNRQRNSEGILMHELNHQIGAYDHYHLLRDPADRTTCEAVRRRGGERGLDGEYLGLCAVGTSFGLTF